MGSERRQHLRIFLPIKAAIFFPDGFLFNALVADAGSGGVRLEIPLVDPLALCQDGLLRFYLQPNAMPGEYPPCTLEIPCRLAWHSDQDVGVEFLNPDPHTQETFDSLLRTDCPVAQGVAAPAV
ncbi:MAG: PilZ domain-containing protein [Magnetococcales bacterium]|nr:PilZ domain-containing protein [Magnetococcales bacterium]